MTATRFLRTIRAGLARTAQLLPKPWIVPDRPVGDGSRPWQVIRVRGSALVLAAFLSPGLLTVFSCERGDTYLLNLEVEVQGQNQIVDYDINERDYDATFDGTEAILRTETRDPGSTVTYQWVVDGETIDVGDVGVGGGEVTLKVPFGQSLLRVSVRAAPPDTAVNAYLVNVTNLSNAGRKELTLACLDSSLFDNIPFLPVELTVDPDIVIADLPMQADISGSTLFPEFLLDLAQLIGPVRRAEFEDMRVVVEVREGATLVGSPPVLDRVPIQTTCAQYESSPGVPAQCDIFNDTGAPDVNGYLGNTDCLFYGAPSSFDRCGEFYTAPVEEDCSICDILPDSSFGPSKSAQCATNGFCIAGPVVLPFVGESATYIVDDNLGGQVLFGLAEGGPGGGGTGAILNPDDSWALPAATLTSPVVQGLRAGLDLGGIRVGMECTMGYDTGTGPGSPEESQEASRLPDADLISFTIGDGCEGVDCDDGDDCTEDICTLGLCTNPIVDGLLCDFSGAPGVCWDGACQAQDRASQSLSIPVVCSRNFVEYFETSLDTTLDPDVAYAGEPLTVTSSSTSVPVTQEMLQDSLEHLFLLGLAIGQTDPITELLVDTGSTARMAAVSGLTGTTRFEGDAPVYTAALPTADSPNPYPNTGGEPCAFANACPLGALNDVIPPGCINGFCGQACTGGFCDPVPCPTPEACPRLATGALVVPFADSTLSDDNTVGGVGEQVCFDQSPFATDVRLTLPGTFDGVEWRCQSGTLATPTGPINTNPVTEPPLMCATVTPFCASDAECTDPTGECMVPACVDGACTEVVAPDGTSCDDLLPLTAGICASGTCVDAMLCAGVDCDDGIACTEDRCDLTTGDCISRVAPAGGCTVEFALSDSSFRHYNNFSSPKPECLPPDLSANPGAELTGIEDRCFIETLPNAGTLSFQKLSGDEWQVSGTEVWAMPSPTGTILIDSTVSFSGTGTGSIEEGGQIVLDPIVGSDNILAFETGTLECSAANTICNLVGYDQGPVALPLPGDPGRRALPPFTFSSPSPGAPLELALAGGATDPNGWYLRNPAPMPYAGTEWASLAGAHLGTTFDFCAGVDCDDGDDCTADSCDDGTCSSVVEPDGSSCDFGGDPGACVSGVCVSRCDWLNCGDSNSCTADSCDPVAGVCVNTTLPNGTSCLGGQTSCFHGICQGKTITLGCTNTLTNETHIVDMNLIVEPIGVTELESNVPFNATVRGEVIFPQSILDDLDVILAAKISDMLITVEEVYGGTTVPLTVSQPSPTCSDDASVCDPALDDPPGSGFNPACTSSFDDRCDLWFHNAVSTDCTPGGVCEMIGKADQCATFGRCVTGPVIFPLEAQVATFTGFLSDIRFEISTGGATENLDGTYQIPLADLDPAQNGPNFGIGTAPEGTAAMNCVMAVDSNGPDGVGVPDGASPSPPSAALVLPLGSDP